MPVPFIDRARVRRIQGNRVVALVAVLALAATGFFLFRATRAERHVLTISAGDGLGHRHEMARLLAEEATLHGVQLELASSRGSEEDVQLIIEGKLDAALIGGEVGRHQAEIREVAVLINEPLHLFVKPEIAARGITGLKGASLNLNRLESGTRHLAHKVLEFIGLTSGTDYEDLHYSYEELINLSDKDLPDGVFALSPLPWKIGARLVQQHGYKLMELPYADAMALSDREIQNVVVPAYSYCVNPPVPEKPLHTVATPMLLIVHRDVSKAAVERMLEIIFEQGFARRASLPPLDPRAVLRVREFQLHRGTISYLKRGEPVVNGQLIDNLENLRSFLVSAALALFLLWRWYKRRELIGFEAYFDAVTQLEQEALMKERTGQLTLADLRRIWQQLASIKAEVLEHHAAGSLSNEDQLVSFLTHVSDVRNCLESLRVSDRSEPLSTTLTPETDAVGGI